jgi:hypothetical protein
MNGCHGCHRRGRSSARRASLRIGISLERGQPVANQKSTTIETGIRQRGDTIEAYVRVNGVVHWRYYPEGLASLADARDWRRRMREGHCRKFTLNRITLPAVEYVPALPEGKTWVYFIQCGDFSCKIGRASDPMRRLMELQVAHPKRIRIVALLCGDPGLERRIHASFDHLRQSGEWFRMSPELRALVHAARAGTVTDANIGGFLSTQIYGKKMGPKRSPSIESTT